MLTVFLSLLLGIIIGVILFPIGIFLRAKNSGWDDSNVFNIFHVLFHLALHPDDFTKMYYKDGNKPFWYLTKDEFSEVLRIRPTSEE